MNPEADEKIIKQLDERFRREAHDNKEKTLGRIVYTLIQIYGEVSYETIRKALHTMIKDSPSNHGKIRPEFDTQLHDANEALLFLLRLHEPHD